MTDSVNPELDVNFEKWVRCIRKAIDGKHEVKILKEKIEIKKEFWKTYKILSIDLEKMKARAVCIENGNSGNLNITSYDLEQLYKHLPDKYKNQEDLKVKEPKKVKEKILENKTIENMENQENVQPETKEKVEETTTEEKVTKPVKVTASNFLKEFINNNENCTVEQMTTEMEKQGVNIPKNLVGYLKSIQKDGPAKGYELTVNENKYSLIYK